MNDVLLINKISPNEDPAKSINLTVIIGQMHKQSTCDGVVAVLEKLEYIDLKKLVLKYNGILIHIHVKNIPDLFKELANSGLQIYGAYEIYE